MPTYLTSDISSLLPAKFDKGLSKQFNAACPLLNALSQRGRVRFDVGQGVYFSLECSGGTISNVSEGADFAASANGVSKSAFLPWGIFQGAIEISDLSRSAARTQGSPFGDLLGDKLGSLASSMGKKINDQLFSGTGSNQIVGLDTALGVGTYATVLRASDPDGYSFQGNLVANGGTGRALTLDLMATAERTNFASSNKSPDLIVMSPVDFARYEKLVVQTNGSFQFGPTPISNADGGALTLSYKGIPVIRDNSATTGSIYFLHTPSLEVVYTNAIVDDAVQAAMLMGDSGESTGIVVDIYQSARVGTKKKLAMNATVQLKALRPNACTILKDINA